MFCVRTHSKTKQIWSCGGAGQCGTCIVAVEGGAELLSERSATEERKLKGVRWTAAAAAGLLLGAVLSVCVRGAAAVAEYVLDVLGVCATTAPLRRRVHPQLTNPRHPCILASPTLHLHPQQKPANWRLACQTIVGDGENSGAVVIATKPQQ